MSGIQQLWNRCQGISCSICSGALTSCALLWKCKIPHAAPAVVVIISSVMQYLCKYALSFKKKIKASRRVLSQLLHMSYFMNPPQVTPRKAAIKVPVGTGLGDILKFLRRVPKGSIYGLFRLELWSSLYRFLKGHVQYQCWFSQATVLNYQCRHQICIELTYVSRCPIVLSSPTLLHFLFPSTAHS